MNNHGSSKETAAVAVQYALVISLIAVALVGAWSALGEKAGCSLVSSAQKMPGGGSAPAPWAGAGSPCGSSGSTSSVGYSASSYSSSESYSSSSSEEYSSSSDPYGWSSSAAWGSSGWSSGAP